MTITTAEFFVIGNTQKMAKKRTQCYDLTPVILLAKLYYSVNSDNTLIMFFSTVLLYPPKYINTFPLGDIIIKQG